MGNVDSWISAEDTIANRPAGGVARLTAPGGPSPRAGGFASPSTIAVSPRWPGARVAAVEALWGEGFTMPGGGQEMVRLVKPLGLSPSATLILLGGGLGGPARSISDAFGAWVTSFEGEPALLEQAGKRNVLQHDRQQNRVTHASWDRLQPALPLHSGNHALSLEALRGAKPLPMLQSLADALSPHAHIVLTELVADRPPSDRDREFAAWCRLDGRLPELPRAQDITDGLQRLHFDVRVVEDMSDRHTTQTLGGWREAVRAMAAGPRPAAATAAAFVNEAELWLLRIRLMRRLGVRLMRWHAIAA